MAIPAITERIVALRKSGKTANEIAKALRLKKEVVDRNIRYAETLHLLTGNEVTYR